MVEDRRRRRGMVVAKPETHNGHSAKRRRLFVGRKQLVGFSPFFRSLSCRHLRSDAGSRSRAEKASKFGGRETRTPPSRRRPQPSSPALAEPSSEEEESDIMGDDDDVDEEDVAEETVQVDFGFFDPKPDDFHGVKLLLNSYLGDREWDLSGFVDLILGQTTVGTVVKSESPEEAEEAEEEEERERDKEEEEDEGPYAVITALNIGRYGTKQCMKELKNHILEACGDDPVKKKIQIMLEGEEANRVGLLLCERFVNFPHQPVLPLYEGLFDEVSWATEDEPTKEICDSFRFKAYLILTRIFVIKEANFRGRPSASSDKKGGGSQDYETFIYPKLEDEIFLKLCSSSFTFDFPQKEQVVPPELKGYKEMGLAMVVEASKVPAFREELKSLLLEAS